MRVMVSTASRRSPDLNLRSNRAVRRSAREGKRTPYNGLASVRFASRKSFGVSLKSAEMTVPSSGLQPNFGGHIFDPRPRGAFTANREPKVTFIQTRGASDF